MGAKRKEKTTAHDRPSKRSNWTIHNKNTRKSLRPGEREVLQKNFFFETEEEEPSSRKSSKPYKSMRNETKPLTDKNAYNPDIIFDEFWSKKDEAKLQASWLSEDQDALEYFSKGGILLGKRCRGLFGSIPPLIFPQGVTIASTHRKKKLPKGHRNPSHGAC